MDVVVQLNHALQDRYDVEREIGAGGMATVYLARDLKHKRPVALKVLRPDIGAVLGAERFLSEIQVTANLQHPNLLPLFDSGEADGYLFYVMPFVEGESLRARLDREKQLPVDEAVHIATAVASALDYAHRHHVIHRDLKPENILMHEGQPLVADFGIALAVSNAGGNRITQTGLSLGTPQYMSPEQATGDRIVDGRTDLYSLGAVTYEMLTGEAPHTGNTSQAVIARLLTEAPRPVRASRPSVPEHVAAAVERALAKLPADRFARAQEFADAITGRTVIQSHTATTAGAISAESLGWRKVMRHPIALGLSALALLGLAGTRKAWQLSRENAADTPLRFVLTFPDEQWVSGTGAPFALSPDGHFLVYVGAHAGGTGRLFVRPLDDLRTQELGGTEGAAQPTFSPDGKWIAFFANGQLRKVPITGGAAVDLAPVPADAGLSWRVMNEIVVSSTGRIATVPAEGGPLSFLPAEVGRTPAQSRSLPGALSRPVLKTAGAYDAWPFALANRRGVVFMRTTSTALAGGRIVSAPLGKGEVRSLGFTGGQPIGMVDDYLIYAAFPGVIMAVPFNKRTLRATGSAVPVANGVLLGRGGAFKGAFSPSGTLVYATGGFAQQLALAEPHGTPLPLLPDLREFSFPRFSPDGKHIAMSITNGDVSDIWVLDLPSGPLRKLTSGTFFNFRPEWTPDSRSVLFVSNRLGKLALFTQPEDGNTQASLLFRMDSVDVYEGVLSRDGNYLFFQRDSTGTSGRTLFRQQHGDTTVHVIAAADEGQQTAARISPDGKWIAYQSDELGSLQVYVKPFPQLDTRYQISLHGGEQPVWSPDSHRLLYLAEDRLLSAKLDFQPSLSIAERDTVLEGVQGVGEYHAQYDVSPDGKSVVFMRGGEAPRVIVVHNWIKELRARMATAKAR